MTVESEAVILQEVAQGVLAIDADGSDLVCCAECEWDNPKPESADCPCPPVRLREALAPLLAEDGATDRRPDRQRGVCPTSQPAPRDGPPPPRRSSVAPRSTGRRVIAPVPIPWRAP